MRGEMRRTSVLRSLPLGVAALMAFSLFACSGEDDDESAGTSTTTEAESDSRTTSSGDGESTSTAAEQATSTTNTTAESCRETGNWTTEPEAVDVGIADPIYLLEAGRHDAPQCYDQLSFRLNGPAQVGYYATYAHGNVVPIEGDQSVTVAGDVALVVDISARWEEARLIDQDTPPHWYLLEPSARRFTPPATPAVSRSSGRSASPANTNPTVSPRRSHHSWSAWTVNVRSQ